MERLTITIALLAMLGTQDQGERIAVQAGRVYTVSGAVIESGVVLIERGRIVDIRAGGDVPEGFKLIDASAQTVIPGLIGAVHSVQGGADTDRSIAPDVRAIDGYDFFEENRLLLSGGITTSFLSPGTRRLLSGQGAVVKTASSDREARVLRSSCGLRVTLGEASKNPPGVYKPPVPPSADDPIRPMERQYPTSRMGQFAELRRLLSKAAEPQSDLTRHERDILKEVLDGSRPLMVSAHTADDMIKAMMFAEEADIRVVFLEAEEAADVKDLLARRNIPVWASAAIFPGEPYEGDAARPLPELDRDPALLAALIQSGVPAALQAAGDRDLRDLLLLAAYTCRSGATPEQALRAVTLTPAEILGIADRVGSLEAGKDADLVFLSGPPLASSTVVQRVMIGGEIVFERRPEDDQTYDVSSRIRASSERTRVLAVRGARILTMTQGIIPEGLILIEDGKISYVGRRRPIPSQAKIIEAAGLTASPGFIDAHTFLGFHTDATESARRGRRVRAGPPPTSLKPPSEYVDLDDPVYKEAVRAGVTTILLAPETNGLCAALKTAGDGTRANLLRQAAAVKISVAGGSSGYETLKALLTRAKRYHEEWEAYERARQEAEEAKTAAPSGRPDPLAGTWKGTVDSVEAGPRVEFTLELKSDGAAVTGTLIVAAPVNLTQDLKGTLTDSVLHLEGEAPGVKVQFTGRLERDALKGKLEIETQETKISGPAEAKRVATAPAAGAAAATGPKEPRKDDSLELYRGLFRREIPALVVAPDVSSIDNAARALDQDFNLPWTLLAPPDVDYAALRVPGALFGPAFLRERRGTVANLAEALAANGVPIGIASSSISGAVHLPFTLAHAVRYGLDGFDALKAVSVNPARMLRLDDRVGSLERGRDGDVVLSAGDPFDLSSRIRMVICNGKIVYQVE
ncbi:MAG: amidohydrolase family protein [Planctomycetes bacterium]|nr:amidohydrolase family protein [Planctomycetota bacterium]